MKHLFTIASILFFTQLKAQTPITLTRADFPKPTTASPLPDSVLYTNIIAATTTAQTMNGTNLIWNESTLSGTTQFQNFVATTATPLAFQLTFLGSDYAQPLLNGISLAGTTATDAFEYYDYASSNSKLQIRGFGANVTVPGTTTALPIPAIYSNPDIIYTFPITFGNMDSSVADFNITVPVTLPAPLGSVNFNVKRNQKRVNHVDAWGSVTTPAGTFDVLRVVSKINRVDSFKTSFFTIGTPTKPVEYKWLAKTKKIPVLQINGTEDSVGNFTQTNTTFWGQAPNAINTINTPNKFSVYPNPTTENVSVSFETTSKSMVAIFVLDITGKKVAEFHFSKNAGKHIEILPIQQLLSGNYLLQIQAEQQIRTIKMIKL